MVEKLAAGAQIENHRIDSFPVPSVKLYYNMLNNKDPLLHTMEAALRDEIIEYHDSVAPTRALLFNEAYQRFLLYLYFPSRIDTESGQTSIPRAVVAHCEGVDPKKVESNNYCARDFFLRFRRDVMPSFSWKKHERGKRSRTVARADLNLELQQKALSLDPATSRERVFVDTGEAWTPQKQRELSRQIKAKANASAKYALCDDQREVLAYINARSPRAFYAAVRRHAEEARATAYALLQDPVKLYSCLATLRAAQELPQPFLKVSRRLRTARLFPATLGLYGLKKEVRQVLTQDWVEVDLANAQLAINAWLWKVEPLLDFLREPTNDWWRELITFLHDDAGFDYQAFKQNQKTLHDAIKKPIKKACYATQFGMGMEWVRSGLSKALPMFKDPGKRLLDHDLFGKLVEARERQMKQLAANGGIRDAYARWLPLTDARDVKSIMAEVAQSWELRLMRPILDVARDHPADLNIMLWIHDGAVINFTKSGKNEAARRTELVAAVQSTADGYGIPTRLTIDPPVHARARE